MSEQTLEQDNTVPQPIGKITTSSIMPGIFLETPDGKAYAIQGLIAMSDGTVRWRE